MKYEELTFIKPIGKGAFGTVYLTSIEGNPNFFATKIIKKSVADSPKMKKYFHNEIEILKEIKHKNIMELIEIKQSEENYYLVCELCNGGSLHHCVNKYLTMYKTPFSEEIVQYLMKQIIQALHYLHGLKIIHRDLKLENILINFKNKYDKEILNLFGAEVKIIDFGFATHSSSGQDLHKSVLGSPLYMDPIILKKYTKKEKNIKGYNENIDIWSLRNLCYEMLLGKPAFETSDIKILEQKIEKGFYYVPNTFFKEVIGFLIGMLQYNSDIRLSAEELLKHPFVIKNIINFERINFKEMKQYIKNDKLEIGIYEDKYLWNLFNSKYPRYLEIIPEDSDISESIYYKEESQQKNNGVNINGNNKDSDEIKIKLLKAFERINEDFLILQPIFIPLIPGNDPKDLFNEEKATDINMLIVINNFKEK